MNTKKESQMVCARSIHHLIPKEILNDGYGYEFRYQLKFIALGGVNTGKTSFLRKYAYGKYIEDTETTIQPDTFAKEVDGTLLSVSMWDTAGQEKLNDFSVSRSLFRGTVGAFIMYDVTSENSIVQAIKWKKYLDSNFKLNNENPIPCLLVANKCDLKDISLEEKARMNSFAYEHKFIDCIYASPKTGANIEEAGARLLREVLKCNGIEGLRKIVSINTRSQLTEDLSQKKTSRCCGGNNNNSVHIHIHLGGSKKSNK